MHDYLAWDSLVPTEAVLRGQTVIGLYFGADWCTPCQGFVPMLKLLYSGRRAHCNNSNRNIPPFEVVLVSGCHDSAATAQYFSTMPWTAMTHAAASGPQGSYLRDMYGITTIPALVLLDGAGTVLCRNGHDRLREDPTGCSFPWQERPSSPRVRQVGFDLLEEPQPVAAIGYAPVPRSPGRPPSFAPIMPSSARDPQYTEEAASALGG
jgi:hypothetical protein